MSGNIGEDFIEAKKADKIGDLLETGRIVKGWIYPPNARDKIRAKGGQVTTIDGVTCIVFDVDRSKGIYQRTIFKENIPVSGIRMAS